MSTRQGRVEVVVQDDRIDEGPSSFGGPTLQGRRRKTGTSGKGVDRENSDCRVHMGPTGETPDDRGSRTLNDVEAGDPRGGH